MVDFDPWALFIVMIFGMGGGAINCVIVKGGFYFPSKEIINGGKSRWNPGFIGNLFLGVMASLIVWGLGSSEVSYPKLIAYCLLSGAAGGNLISSILQRDLMTSLENKANLEDLKSQSMYEKTEKMLDLIEEERRKEKTADKTADKEDNNG